MNPTLNSLVLDLFNRAIFQIPIMCVVLNCLSHVLTKCQWVGNKMNSDQLTCPTASFQFDFISFAQYTAVSREIIQDPPFVFVEKQPVEVPDGEPQKFVDTVIRRDPSLTNAMLPVEHSKRVGTRIFNQLTELFAESPSAIPKFETSLPSSQQLLAALKQLVALFVLNGYAFDGNASILDSGKSQQRKFSLSLTSPCTLWGCQALQREGAAVTNNFL